MPTPRRLLIAALALSLAAPLTARAATVDDPALVHITTLNLQAEGLVKADPDQAVISFGVQTQAPAAADAMAQNRKRMTAVLAALRTAGIDAKDVQTSSLRLNTQYTYAPNQPPRLGGYQATNQVSVLVHDLAKLGSTVDAVTSAGVNEIGGITFSLSDPKLAEDEARRRAVKTLATRAALYAEASGLKLGRLIALSEGGAQPPSGPVVFAAARLRAAEAPTPIEPGQLTVQIEVSATYELVK